MRPRELALNWPHINTKTATSWLLQDESTPPGGQDQPSACPELVEGKSEAIPFRVPSFKFQVPGPINPSIH